MTERFLLRTTINWIYAIGWMVDRYDYWSKRRRGIVKMHNTIHDNVYVMEVKYIFATHYFGVCNRHGSIGVENDQRLDTEFAERIIK